VEGFQRTQILTAGLKDVEGAIDDRLGDGLLAIT
jgi:hypothetical protein